MGTWKPPKARPPAPPAPPAAPPATPPPTTIAEAKAQDPNLVAGTPLVAPLAPKRGPIPGKSGDLVVTVLKDLKDSPTIKAVRRVIASAILAIVAIVLGQCALAWGAGKSLADPGAIDWRVTERLAEIAGGTVITSAFFGYMKRRDNDPVKQ